MAGDKICGVSGCGKVGVHLCGGCGERTYCSRECQKSDWTDHKVDCKSATKPEAVALTQSFKSLSVTQLKNLVRAKAASYTESKKKVTLEKLSKIAEKEHLVRFAEEHVHPAETEALLSGGVNPVVGGLGSSSGAGSNKARQKARQAVQMQQGGAGGQLAPGQAPSVEQVRRQATEMRKNPDAVRRADQMFKNMSNAEIFAYADQIEAAAADPAMFQEMLRMSQMPAKDRDQLQVLQQGMTGQVARDEKWIQSVVSTVKTNPGMLKAMYKGKMDPKAGISEDQVEGFIDTIVGLPDWLLVLVGRAICWAVEAWPTVQAAYQKADDWTLGCAKYLLMAVLFYLFYTFVRWVWWAAVLLFGLLKSAYHLVLGGGSTSMPAYDPEAVSGAAKTFAKKAAGGSGSAADFVEDF